ncbi:MAG TPA: FAD-dependent oxidoreductase [Actinomycetota bacterium]|nr:FAD-dependent oxidoreductase [Actinomycetota bacterium]
MAGPVAVVGSGIVGSAIAWQLQALGAPTILVDDPEPRGASYFSFASLTAMDEPLSEVYALKCLGMSHWRRWQKELGGDIGVRWDGEIRWAESSEGAAALREKVKRAKGRGYPVENISAPELIRRLPHSRPGPVLAASFAADDGQANARKAIARLRAAFEEAGGRLENGRARLRFDGDGVVVRIGSRELEASRVVIAGGAETMSLLHKLGWEVPMDPSPGLLVLTEPMDPVLTGTAYVTPAEGLPIHLRQQHDDRVLIGERSQDHVAKNPNIGHAEELLRQAKRFFPILRNARVSEFTVEWRPMPRDGMPIIGPLPGFSSVYVATGHSGVTIAPAVAALLGPELLEDRASEQMEPFRPGRFADREAFVASEVESAFNLG